MALTDAAGKLIWTDQKYLLVFVITVLILGSVSAYPAFSASGTIRSTYLKDFDVITVDCKIKDITGQIKDKNITEEKCTEAVLKVFEQSFRKKFSNEDVKFSAYGAPYKLSTHPNALVYTFDIEIFPPEKAPRYLDILWKQNAEITYKMERLQLGGNGGRKQVKEGSLLLDRAILPVDNSEYLKKLIIDIVDAHINSIINPMRPNIEKARKESKYVLDIIQTQGLKIAGE